MTFLCIHAPKHRTPEIDQAVDEQILSGSPCHDIGCDCPVGVVIAGSRRCGDVVRPDGAAVNSGSAGEGIGAKIRCRAVLMCGEREDSLMMVLPRRSPEFGEKWRYER